MRSEPRVLCCDDLDAERKVLLSALEGGAVHKDLRLKMTSNAEDFLYQVKGNEVAYIIDVDLSRAGRPSPAVTSSWGLESGIWNDSTRREGLIVANAILARFPMARVLLITAERAISVGEIGSDLFSKVSFIVKENGGSAWTNYLKAPLLHALAAWRDREDLELRRRREMREPERVLASVQEFSSGRKSIDSISLPGGKELLTINPEFQELLRESAKAAKSSETVLILGESGTGKELLAHYIHQKSERNGPFLGINCSNFSKGLIASELFGHERGSFTDAVRQKIGLFEQARGGTLFLDEISDMDFDLQARLLRALQEKQIMRVGGDRLIDIDVRVISATNADIEQAAEENRFRLDLLYRLRYFPFRIPPLRQRQEDIPLLFRYFLDGKSDKSTEVQPSAMEFLTSLAWKGNARDLEALASRCVTFYRSPITYDEVRVEMGRVEPAQHGGQPSESLEDQQLEIARQLVREILEGRREPRAPRELNIEFDWSLAILRVFLREIAFQVPTTEQRSRLFGLTPTGKCLLLSRIRTLMTKSDVLLPELKAVFEQASTPTAAMQAVASHERATSARSG